MCLQDFKTFLFKRYSNGNFSLQGFTQHITRERDSLGSQFCQEAQHLNRCVSELISGENRISCGGSKKHIHSGDFQIALWAGGDKRWDETCKFPRSSLTCRTVWRRETWQITTTAKCNQSPCSCIIPRVSADGKICGIGATAMVQRPRAHTVLVRTQVQSPASTGGWGWGHGKEANSHL